MDFDFLNCCRWILDLNYFGGLVVIYGIEFLKYLFLMVLVLLGFYCEWFNGIGCVLIEFVVISVSWIGILWLFIVFIVFFLIWNVGNFLEVWFFFL